MAALLRGGISYAGSHVTLALIEQKENSFELKRLEEESIPKRNGVWFLEILRSIDKKTLGRIAAISVSLDNADVHLLAFPMDSALNRVEQNEHVQWEQSHHIPHYRASEYLTDLHTLKTHARDRVVDTLAVSVPRATIYKIQSALSAQKLNLAKVHIGQLAAAISLQFSNPEIKTQNCALLGIDADRLDLSFIANGRMVQYDHNRSQSIAELCSWLQPKISVYEPTSVFAYGGDVPAETMKGLRGALNRPITLLNPLKRFQISAETPVNGKILGKEHRFAACIGCALG
jgi:Tfp pilus assembly PilM family ATPase